MKLIIEVEVPDNTVKQVQEFVRVEDAFDSGNLDDAIDPEDVNAVDVFFALHRSGQVDFEVTKAEMTDKRCYHLEYKGGYCAEMSCDNYISKAQHVAKPRVYEGPDQL